MEYKVKYTDNTGIDNRIMVFNTEEEAENVIEEELNNVKEYYKDRDYNYADFGNKTEFWISGDDEYCSWERMWL